MVQKKGTPSERTYDPRIAICAIQDEKGVKIVDLYPTIRDKDGLDRRRPVMNRWHEVVSFKLRDRLMALAQEDQETRMSLKDEVDLVRTMMDQAVVCYDQICIQDALKGKVSASEEVAAKEAARLELKKAIEFTRKLVSSAAKIEAMKQDKLPAYNIALVLTQINTIIQRHVKDTKVAELICKEFDEIKVVPDEEGKLGPNPRIMLTLD